MLALLVGAVVAMTGHELSSKVVFWVSNVSRQRIEAQLVAELSSVQPRARELIVVRHPSIDVNMSSPVLHGLNFVDWNGLCFIGNNLLGSQDIGFGFARIRKAKVLGQFPRRGVDIYPFLKILSRSISAIRYWDIYAPRYDFFVNNPCSNLARWGEVYEGTLTADQASSGYSVGLDHLAPHKERYEGVDGRCHDRSPSRLFYGFLSGVCAVIFGLRVSYRLIAKGDDCAYFFGWIDWHLLVPFSFLCTAYGFGAFVECTLYFTNPCYEGHSREIVPQKHLTNNSYWGTVIDMANVLNADKQIAVIGALAEGSSIRSIERITGVHRDTIMRLGVKVGQGCAKMLDTSMRNLPCNRLEMDEIWGFVGKKDRNVREGDNAVGSVWTFCAIDAETKLVPAFKVGNRDAATAKAFVQDVAERMAYRVQISTDGLNAYVAAMESAFGGNVDYAQIIKTYGHEEVSNNRRYSAPEFVSSEKKIVVGNPDERLISTSYIERLNATTRLHMRRLTRLTLAFSKKRENFEAAVALHFAYYNFVKRHSTIRCTPAMAAGVTGSFWSVGDLLEAAA